MSVFAVASRSPRKHRAHTAAWALRLVFSVGASVLSFFATLFSPRRRRIQDFIDHRFYRRKYDAALALERFALVTRNEVALEALTAEIANLLHDTVQPSSISFWGLAAKKARR